MGPTKNMGLGKISYSTGIEATSLGNSSSPISGLSQRKGWTSLWEAMVWANKASFNDLQKSRRAPSLPGFIRLKQKTSGFEESHRRVNLDPPSNP